MEMEKTKSNNNQKALGFLLILFLSVTYKDMVLDPYLKSRNPESSVASSVNQTAASVNQISAPAVQSAQVQTLPAGNFPSVGQASIAATTAFPTDSQIDQAGFVIFENDTVFLRVSLLGGRVREFRLKKYLERNSKDSPLYNIISHIDSQPLPLGVTTGAENDAWVLYAKEDLAPNKINLVGQLHDGRKITKSLELTPKNYLLDVAVTLSAAPKDGARMTLEWTNFFAKDSAAFKDSQNTGGFVWFDGAKAYRETYSGFKVAEKVFAEARWISTTDHYFVASIITPSAPGIARAQIQGDLLSISMTGESERGNFQLLAAPKSYKILSALGSGLERNIDFGVTGFLSAPLLMMLNMLYGFLGNFGLAIVALTITVRLLLLPLNAASFRSMKAMQDLQPEVQKLKESIQDKQQQQVAMMALYKKKGVNPLGGCLPMVCQLPIFLGLYSALLLSVGLRHAPFAIWIRDLSAPEQLMFGTVGIPVMVVLFVISMLYQQWSTPSTMDETQKKILLVMPVIFGFAFFIHMPAGLTLYWLTSNIISIVQMKQLRKAGKHNAFLITTAVAGLVFVFAFVLTKIS